MSSEYPKSVRTLANALYQYREMSDEFAYLRDERQEEYLEEALFIHYSSWLAAEQAAAYRRGLESSLEILGAEATSASYHGWKSADEEFMKLHKKIRQEIQHPMLDRMTGNPKAEGRYDDEQ